MKIHSDESFPILVFVEESAVLYYVLYIHRDKLAQLIHWFEIKVEWFQKKCLSIFGLEKIG